MLGAGPSGPWFKRPRRSRRNNRRGSLGPCRNPTPAPHADQKVTAQCFRLLSRPSRNCCDCFRAARCAGGAKKWGPQSRPPRLGQVTGRKGAGGRRSEEHTSELQSLMRNSYAVFCLKITQTAKVNNTRGLTL